MAKSKPLGDFCAEPLPVVCFLLPIAQGDWQSLRLASHDFLTPTVKCIRSVPPHLRGMNLDRVIRAPMIRWTPSEKPETDKFYILPAAASAAPLEFLNFHNIPGIYVPSCLSLSLKNKGSMV